MHSRCISYSFILLLLLCTSISRASDELIKKTFHTSYHSFSLESNLIVVQAKVNGIEGNYILDTGASGLVLNADRHSSSTQRSCIIQGVSNSKAKALKTKISAFRFGNIVKQNITAACLSLGHIESSMDITLDGLIGMDILSEASIYIDYDAQLISLLDPSTVERTPDYSLDISFVNSIPVVATEIQGKRVNMAIDFGASTSLICATVADGLDLQVIAQVDLQTASGTEQLLDKVALKDITLDGVYDYGTTAVVADLSHLSSGETSIHGLIGLDLLKSRKIMISPSSQQLLIWE